MIKHLVCLALTSLPLLTYPMLSGAATHEPNTSCNCPHINDSILGTSLCTHPSTDLKAGKSFLVPVKKYSWKLCIENYQDNLVCFNIPLDPRDVDEDPSVIKPSEN